MNLNISVSNLINVVFIAVGLGICSMSIMQVGTGIHINKEVNYFIFYLHFLDIFCHHKCL